MVRLSDIPTEEAAHLLSKSCDPFDTRPWVVGPAQGAFGQMIWLDTQRGVSIAQFGAQSGDGPAAAPEVIEDTHAAMRATVDAVAK